MPDVTIVFWRDIPAQVIVGTGRRAARKPLPERFEAAIDRAAMKAGAKDSEAYLAEWRRAEPYHVEGDAEDVALSEAVRLETAFSPDTLKVLIANGGWDPQRATNTTTDTTGETPSETDDPRPLPQP